MLEGWCAVLPRALFLTASLSSGCWNDASHTVGRRAVFVGQFWNATCCWVGSQCTTLGKPGLQADCNPNPQPISLARFQLTTFKSKSTPCLGSKKNQDPPLIGASDLHNPHPGDAGNVCHVPKDSKIPKVPKGFFNMSSASLLGFSSTGKKNSTYKKLSWAVCLRWVRQGQVHFGVSGLAQPSRGSCTGIFQKGGSGPRKRADVAPWLCATMPGNYGFGSGWWCFDKGEQLELQLGLALDETPNTTSPNQENKKKCLRIEPKKNRLLIG